MSKVVKTGDITVTYAIYEYETADGTKYDWEADGNESDSFFDTPEEAEADVLRSF